MWNGRRGQNDRQESLELGVQFANSLLFCMLPRCLPTENASKSTIEEQKEHGVSLILLALDMCWWSLHGNIDYLSREHPCHGSIRGILKNISEFVAQFPSLREFMENSNQFIDQTKPNALESWRALSLTLTEIDSLLLFSHFCATMVDNMLFKIPSANSRAWLRCVATSIYYLAESSFPNLSTGLRNYMTIEIQVLLLAGFTLLDLGDPCIISFLIFYLMS